MACRRTRQHAALRERADDDSATSIRGDRRRCWIKCNRELGFSESYDIDLLVKPGYARLLDTLAESPGRSAAGTREWISPETWGNIWPDRDQPPDFTATFAGLGGLT